MDSPPRHAEVVIAADAAGDAAAFDKEAAKAIADWHQFWRQLGDAVQQEPRQALRTLDTGRTWLRRVSDDLRRRPIGEAIGATEYAGALKTFLASMEETRESESVKELVSFAKFIGAARADKLQTDVEERLAPAFEAVRLARQRFLAANGLPAEIPPLRAPLFASLAAAGPFHLAAAAKPRPVGSH